METFQNKVADPDEEIEKRHLLLHVSFGRCSRVIITEYCVQLEISFRDA